MTLTTIIDYIQRWCLLQCYVSYYLQSNNGEVRWGSLMDVTGGERWPHHHQTERSTLYPWLWWGWSRQWPRWAQPSPITRCPWWGPRCCWRSLSYVIKIQLHTRGISCLYLCLYGIRTCKISIIKIQPIRAQSRGSWTNESGPHSPLCLRSSLHWCCSPSSSWEPGCSSPPSPTWWGRWSLGSSSSSSFPWLNCSSSSWAWSVSPRPFWAEQVEIIIQALLSFVQLLLYCALIGREPHSEAWGYACQLSYAIKNQLKARLWDDFVPFAGSLWHMWGWLPYTEGIYGRPSHKQSLDICEQVWLPDIVIPTTRLTSRLYTGSWRHCSGRSTPLQRTFSTRSLSMIIYIISDCNLLIKLNIFIFICTVCLPCCQFIPLNLKLMRCQGQSAKN